MPDLTGIFDHARALRRRLHACPELGYDEHETAGIVRGTLDDLGITWQRGPDDAPTATVATVGEGPRCVLLRADIDALPIREHTGLAYASARPGLMHACGHDGHTATLLATAATLVMDPPEKVAVKLVFQPAEEGGGGGRRLCEAGVLGEEPRFGPKVDAAFGLHGWPHLPVGTVSTKAGPLLAATDTFEATLVGKGGHAAFPHYTRDPLAVAAGCVVDLQQVVGREIDPTEPAVVSVTRFHAGTANNVIADEATLGGTCRTLSPGTRVFAREAVERRLRGVASAGRCELKFVWNDGYPPTVNDPAMADLVREVAGDTFVPAARPTMGGEDFAYYLERVPGCFFLIGLAPRDGSAWADLHTERFDFNDDATPTGVRTFLGIVRRFAE